MGEKFTQVNCRLVDCMYYHVDPAQPEEVFCKHVDKPHYMKNPTCPLYRLDWQKKAQVNQQILKNLLKK